MKRKMNKKIKWLALGATLALGSAFVVPAVFNEAPVAVKQTVSAEETYESVDGISIVASHNHITSEGIGWNCNLLIRLTKGGTVVSLNKTLEQGNFFTNATIDIGDGAVSLKNSKFGFSSYEVVNHGATYYNMIYAPNKTWEDPAAGAMYTMTIPVGTIVYNYQFSQEVKLYFYGGAWHTEKMIVEGDPEYVQLQAATGAIDATWNHKDFQGKKALILYAWEEGQTTGLPLNYSYYQGDFNQAILLDGETTDVIQFLVSGGHSANGSSPIHLDYTVDWETTTESYHTLTIPAGTTLYNIKFVNELNYYFYNGQWQTEQPQIDVGGGEGEEGEETEYLSVDGVSIAPSVNHYLIWGSHRHLVLYMQKNGATQPIDRTVDAGNFFQNITLDGVANSTSNKFVYQNAAAYTTENYLYVQYVDADWTNPEAGQMYTLTIPEGTTFHNVQFSQEVKLYFYGGSWHTTKLIVEGDPEYVQLQAATAAINPSYNHATHTNGHKALILHAWEEGKTVGLDLNFDYAQGNFNEAVLLDGQPTDVIQFLVSSPHVGTGSSAIHLDYDVDWATTTESYHTFTIPAGTTLYNIKFVNELNYYFFNGEWITDKPVTDSEKVFVETDRVGFEPSFNHVYYDVKGKMATIIYSYAADQTNATKLNFAYGMGNFNDNIYLTEYKNGQEGAQIKGKIWFVSGTHAQNGLSPIHLEYDKDDTFWAVTTDKYYILTIPADTVLYNVKFQNETKLYFYEGKWITKQPLTADEMEFLEVDTLRINAAYNHKAEKDMNALILHGFSADDKKVSMVPNKVYPTGDFLSKIGVYDKDGKKIEGVEFILGTKMGHMGETSSAIHLAYPIDESFWVKTLDTYYELRIEEGAKLFNFVMAKTFRYYFYNGAWMESKPVVDYKVNLDNLPTYTLGEVIEAKPSKLGTFVMGELGGDNENVVAGSFSSPILNAKEYKLNFGMTILSDEYRFAFSLNSSASDVWGGLTFIFDRINAGAAGYAQGVHYLDYINVNGSFLGTGGDYYLTDKWFEPNVAYDVTITMALDENDLGVLMMLTVNGEEWGRLFVPPTGDYTMRELMSSGFLLSVDNGDGQYFGTVEFTNKDVNAPTLNVKNSVIESGSVAEGYAYDVEVFDLLDGDVEYTAVIVNVGDLVDGKFVEGKTYTVRFTATDKAGNEMIKDETFTVAYDVTAPVVTVSDQVDDGTIRLSIGLTEEKIKAAIAAKANDNKDGEVAVTYNFPNGMFDEKGKLTEGNFRVEIVAKDQSGNETKLTVRVRATENAPSTTESESGCNGGCGGTVTLAASAVLLTAVGAALLKKKKED